MTAITFEVEIIEMGKAYIIHTTRRLDQVLNNKVKKVEGVNYSFFEETSPYSLMVYTAKLFDPADIITEIQKIIVDHFQEED